MGQCFEIVLLTAFSPSVVHLRRVCYCGETPRDSERRLGPLGHLVTLLQDLWNGCSVSGQGMQQPKVRTDSSSVEHRLETSLGVYSFSAVTFVFHRPEFGGKYCTGERKRYRTCNTKPCEKNKPSFREMLCSEFDTVPYHNELYQWVPVANPCKWSNLQLKTTDRHTDASSTLFSLPDISKGS